VTTPDLIPLAVSTDRLPDDSYAAVVSIGGDLSWTLPAPRARRYAAAVVDAATAAEHDAATYGALTCKGIPEELVAEVILRAREERPPADRWTDPLTVIRGIQAVEPHGPFLHAFHRDRPDLAWQWSPEDARRHAGQVLQVVAAAELDSALVRALAALSVPSETRAAVVDHVGRHWPSSGGSFPSEDL
jgi:hypothetical protein